MSDSLGKPPEKKKEKSVKVYVYFLLYLLCASHGDVILKPFSGTPEGQKKMRRIRGVHT
jgi:hypothetical protein